MVKRVQLSLVLDNDELWLNYIQPLKDNRELTSMVTRLLEAYFMSDEVRIAVDSYGLEDVGVAQASNDAYDEAIKKAMETVAMMSLMTDSAQDALMEGTYTIEEIMKRADELRQEGVVVSKVETPEPEVEPEPVQALPVATTEVEERLGSLENDMSSIKGMLGQILDKLTAVETVSASVQKAEITEEVAETVEEDDFANLFESAVQPVVQQDMPVTQQVVSPIVQEVTPVVQQVAQQMPVQQEVIQPTVQTVTQPVMQEMIQPVVQQMPVQQMPVQPMVQEVTPVAQQMPVQPMVQEVAPVVQQMPVPQVAQQIPVQPMIQPVVQQTVQPTVAVQPVAQQMIQQTVQPVMQEMVQPVAQQMVQPVMQEMAQPVVQQTVQPMMQEMTQPTVAEQPVIQPVAEEPVEEKDGTDSLMALFGSII